MSCTSVYSLFKTKVNCEVQLRNGHGSGPAVWDYISNKLYNKNFDTFNADGFWGSYKDPRLDDDEVAVLLSTYDNSFVELDYLVEFSIACVKLHPMIINGTRWTWNHFQEIGVEAAKLFNNHDYRCKGMAIGCTSVNDVWEQQNPKDIESWGVYGEIESLKRGLKEVK